MGSKVVVTRSKLDLLADSVSAKSGESLPLTIGEMKVAVDSIVLNSQIIGDGELNVDENDYLYFEDDGGGGITPTGTINITTNGTHDVTNYASANVNVSTSVQTQTKSATPSESQQTITPDSGYYLSSVTVGAIDSGYVGSGVSRKLSTDLTVSGATVTAPAGYYESAASKSVASGSAGTPSASKGTVSNHSISVTPNVTNTTGYITGGTKTGTAVSVAASELVSGTLSITSSGTKDVTNYASASVAAGTEGTPTATKGTVSNHQVTVTPSVTNSAGYITGSTKTGTAVIVTASELASGNKDISQNGTGIDVVGYSTVSVDVDPSLQAKTNISPTTSSQTITADSGYDGLSSVQINAMPSGTAGTPSATKGTVSNHQVTVTPSVTNTTGYITGGTKTGTAITVTASELASGNKAISANGTGIDVVGYSTVSVAVPFSTITVSSSSPSGGSDGDIWIKTS